MRIERPRETQNASQQNRNWPIRKLEPLCDFSPRTRQGSAMIARHHCRQFQFSSAPSKGSRKVADHTVGFFLMIFHSLGPADVVHERRCLQYCARIELRIWLPSV